MSEQPRSLFSVSAPVRQNNGYAQTLRRFRRLPQIPGTALTRLTHYLASLLASGIDLLSALDIAIQHSGAGATQTVLQCIRRDIAGGQRFSDALQKHARTFDAVYCQMVRLGETAACLPEMLYRIAATRERQATRRRACIQAVRYPLFVCSFALLMVIAMLHWAIPAFEPLFSGFDTPLPALTVTVMALSKPLPLLMPAAFASALLTALILRMTMQRRPRWRYRWHALRLKLPGIGIWRRDTALAQWSDGIATLLSAGCPLGEALHLQAGCASDAVFDAACLQIRQKLAQGQSFSTAMRRCACFPASVVLVVAIAERSGKLEAMLNDLSARCAGSAQQRMDSLLLCLGPAVVSLSGVFVAILVISLYLPIIELGNVV